MLFLVINNIVRIGVWAYILYYEGELTHWDKWRSHLIDVGSDDIDTGCHDINYTFQAFNFCYYTLIECTGILSIIFVIKVPQKRKVSRNESNITRTLA